MPKKHTGLPTSLPCPRCSSGRLVERRSSHGPFFGCSNYPVCRFTAGVAADGSPRSSDRPAGVSCGRCGRPMVVKAGRYGPFAACTGFPGCRNTMEVAVDGALVAAVDTGVVCPRCGGKTAVKSGRYGPFLACTSYPACRFRSPLPARGTDGEAGGPRPGSRHPSPP